ncbi:MAG: protein kinase [Gemmatimonadetes bacterium]|nr:protein kinase [Gemmatimonadota bacterium]
MKDLRARLQATLGDAYTLDRELGGGGMSRVFTAIERALGRTVVVKVIAPELAEGVSAERFGREIQLAASLQQANIVPLLAAGDAGGVPYYTMPFVQGESLRGRLSSGAPISVSEGVSILKDVARALSYAHAHGVVHRDIKPDNVLLSHGAAVVTDFGIAKAVSAARTLPGASTLTQAGTSIGTPAYMAPEQIAGDPNVDHRADLYAWGCLAYELFTGRPPFVGDTPQRILAAHLGEQPAPIAAKRADLPLSLSNLVMRCLQKEPAQRPAGADEILRDLDTAFTPGASSAERPAGTNRGPRRNLRIALAIAVVTIGVVGGLFLRGRARSATAAGFGIGLSEEITRALSKNGVRVVGRTSASALQAQGLDERAIARQLGVGSLLTGSVQRADGSVRITVSLVSAADGTVRWTDKYDRPLTNVFALQDEIARTVAGKLLGAVASGRSVATARNETSDPEAYALFLQGQVLFNRRTAQSLQQAIALLDKAVQRDPKFARAQGLLAMSYALLPVYDPRDVDRSLARALSAADQAIAIDSTVAEAYTAKAWMRRNSHESREADRLFQRSIALDSTVATAWGWYGLLAMEKREYAAAHQRIAKAAELEPVSMVTRVWEAQTLIAERREAEAEALTRRTVELDSTYALNWDTRAIALTALGRHAEAVAIMERRVALLPPPPLTETHGILAYCYARAGRMADARRVVEQMRNANGGHVPATGVLAATLWELGEHDAAVTLLEEAFRTYTGWLNIYANAERFDHMRKDPRAAAILEKVAAW